MRIDTGPSGQLRRRVGCSPTSHGGLSEDPQRREFLPVGVLALLPVPGSGRNAKIIFEPEGRSGVSYQDRGRCSTRRAITQARPD
jgi:hypothetical protein